MASARGRRNGLKCTWFTFVFASSSLCILAGLSQDAPHVWPATPVAAALGHPSSHKCMLEVPARGEGHTASSPSSRVVGGLQRALWTGGLRRQQGLYRRIDSRPLPGTHLLLASVVLVRDLSMLNRSRVVQMYGDSVWWTPVHIHLNPLQPPIRFNLNKVKLCQKDPFRLGSRGSVSQSVSQSVSE